MPGTLENRDQLIKSRANGYRTQFNSLSSETITASVTTTSGAVSLPATLPGAQVFGYRIRNTGANTVFLSVAGTATTADYAIPSGQSVDVEHFPGNSYNAITASGSSSLGTAIGYLYNVTN